MTSTTLPTVEHRHVGGSAGGPGENSAECACGTVFDGFDTHREAVGQIEHHIREAQETKRADHLAVGDWVAMLLDGDPWETRQNAEVLAVFPYTDEVENARVLLVAKAARATCPETARLMADQPVRVLTADELAAIREHTERAQRIADIRAFADFLEHNPWAPMPYESAQAEMAIEAIYEYGERVGTPADTRLDDRTQVFHKFGGFEYRVIAWHRDGRPAEPDAAKPLVSDETLAELDAMAARDLAAGGKPWEVPSHPENSQQGGWHHGLLDPTGLTYSREQEDPTPVSPARGGPVHTGAVVDGGELVDETDSKPMPGCLPGCRRTDREYGKGSSSHADDCPEWAAAKAREAEVPASGLTPAADQSRGPLAGTTPVVTYFSFGHGQTDPDSGQRLIDHYVTVVAPTYDQCWEAMNASRFGQNWSWDYLAGRAKTTEAVSRWTEHEVIVAPGTDPALAESALKAAAALLVAEPPVHLEVAGAKTKCGLRVLALPAYEAWTNDYSTVTCKACTDATAAEPVSEASR